jgi:hypothetical protein
LPDVAGSRGSSEGSVRDERQSARRQLEGPARVALEQSGGRIDLD